MLIRCFKGLIVLSERPPTEMKKGVGHWYEKKMERKNTILTFLDMGRFTILLFCMNLGLKYENKCMAKAPKRKCRTHPTKYERCSRKKSLKYLALMAVGAKRR